MGQEIVGKLVFELADDVVPKTVDNFLRLCDDNKSFIKKSYRNSKIHHIQAGSVVMGGDIETQEGLYSHSSFRNRYFQDENFIIPHSQRGLIRFVSI